jgi:predicted Holliday junction resolvase-like endonuclease
MNTVLPIAIILVIALLCIFLIYHLIRLRFERRYWQWREAEEQKWEQEKEIARREAIAQSRTVLGGKFAEQLAPYLPDFRYDPTEARFIGTPIDLIVFPGLATGDPQEIVIMEIKSGQSGQLTPQQRKIRQLIENGMVRWELIHLPGQQPE